MKRFYLSMLVVMSLVVLIGCNSEPNTELLDAELIYSDEELSEIAIPLIESSIDVYDKIMCCNFELTQAEKLKPGFDYIHNNSLMYYRAATLHSKGEVWDFAHTAFTASAAKRLFSLNIDGGGNYSPKFIEENKSLYTLLPISFVDLSSLVLKDITSLSQSENAFSVLADFYYTKAILHFVNEEGKWKIDNSVFEGEKEYQSGTITTPAPIPVTFINDNEFLINRAELSKSDAVSESEAKEIFKSLFERSEYVENILMHSTFRDSRERINYNGTSYCFVDFPELKSLADVWNNVLSAYTEDAANRLYAERLDKESDNPKFIEKNGKLYCEEAGRGNASSYDYESVKLVEQYENLLVMSIDQFYGSSFEKKQIFVLQQNEHGWRMVHSSLEEAITADFQYESIDLVTLSEGEFFGYAPLQINNFPADFEHKGEVITINEPIYTGIKTDTIRTYKEFFAFENDMLVLRGLVSDGESAKERFFLLDKSGKLINTDYHSNTVLKDVKSISTYPEGFEVLQTGESGSYKAELYKDGKPISEVFDEIGYFYNGLALVRKGNKYGIISLDG